MSTASDTTTTAMTCMPAAPIPEMDRPDMRALMVGLTAHNTLPATKMTMETRKIRLEAKTSANCPNSRPVAVCTRTKLAVTHVIESKAAKCDTIVGSATARIVKSRAHRKVDTKMPSSGQLQVSKSCRDGMHTQSRRINRLRPFR